MAHTLEQKLRKPARDKAAPVNWDPLHPSSRKLPQQAGGRPTFAGVYRQLWPRLRSVRKLARSTAKQYDSVMATQILPRWTMEKAFEELDEDDFISMWDRICRADLPKSSLQIASVVIRTMMDLAYEQGLTQTVLWGLPQYQIFPEKGGPVELSPCTDPEEEGARLAGLALRTPRSISLEVEFALAKGMIDHCAYHGELIAALIMLCLGTRTSEATGFSYKHLSEICPGYQALVRYEVSNKDARTTRAGGKTNNAFRLLPLPQFLAKILLARKEALQRQYSPEEIKNLPLACRGVDYACRCTQKELNERMKTLYRQAGVAEDLMRSAYQEMRENPDLAADCEGRATAYLCRHQFATAMVYCGLTPGEIYTVMGHAEEDEAVYKSDFSNPDAFCRLADKMSRRPLVQIFDRLPARRACLCRDAQVPIRSDGSVDLYFPAGGSFEISLLEAEYGHKPELEPEGVDVFKEVPICLPEDRADTFSMRDDLYMLGEQAWKAVADRTVVLPAPAAAIDRPGEEGAGDLRTVRALRPGAGDLPSAGPQAAEKVSQPSCGVQEVQTAPNREEEGGVQVPVPSGPARPAAREAGYASAGGTLYVLDRSGLIRPLPSQQPIRRRNLVGTWLLEKKCAAPMALLCCREWESALVLSSDGMLYRLVPGGRLDSPEFRRADNPAYHALCGGGILLQGPELEQADAVVDVLSDRGDIRRVSLERFQRISPEGRRLVEVPEGDRLVSACLCSGRADLLLVSARGKVLRLPAGDLRPVTTPGSALYTGMALAAEDCAVRCYPYASGTEYLFVTRFGRVARLAGSAEILPHGRGSQGARRVRVGKGDQIVALLPAAHALLLVAENGKGLCIQTESIPVTAGVTQGVGAMDLRPPNAVLAAVGMGGEAPDSHAHMVTG